MSLFLLAAVAAADPNPPLPRSQWAPFVITFSDAIARRDPRPIESGVRITDAEGPPLDEVAGETVIALFRGCRQTAVRRLDPTAFRMSFACPARRAKASGCETGDLSLILSYRRAIIDHDRKLVANCLRAPPPVPVIRP